MADYKYTQQSGDDWKVNTSDKADAYENTNEVRAVVDELGELLGHSLKDGSFPEDLASGGTLIDPTFTDSVITNTATSGDPHIILSENSVTKWDIYNDHADDALQIHSTTGVGLVMEIDNDGDVHLNGSITLSSGGGQITFPATQNASTGANVLDDYEEGSWTMGISFGGGSSGITYNLNTGYYTKIGNLVSISGNMVLTSKGTSTGNAYITGLPFTIVNNDAAYSAMGFMLAQITFADQYSGVAVKNTTTVRFLETTTTGALSLLTNANFANNSQIMIGGTYRAA